MMQQPGSPGAFWCPLPDFLHSSLVSFGGLLYKTVSTDVIGRALLPFELTSSECLQQPPKDSIYKPWNSPLFFLCPVSLPPYRPKPSPFASIPLGYENLNGFSLIFVYAHAPPPPNFTPCSCLRPVTLYPATVVSRTRAARFGISRRTAPPSCWDTHTFTVSQSVSVNHTRSVDICLYARARLETGID